MHTRDYAAAALAELTEELERLQRLSASPETLATAYHHTAEAVRGLISAEFRPWLEDELTALRATHALSEDSPIQAGLEAVSEFLEELKPDPVAEPDIGTGSAA